MLSELGQQPEHLPSIGCGLKPDTIYDMPDAAPPTQEQLASPLWRIRSIYTIRNRKGKPQAFKPTPEQAVEHITWRFLKDRGIL